MIRGASCLLFMGIGIAGSVLAQETLKPAAFERSGADVFKRINEGLDPASCSESAAKSTWMKDYIHDPDRFERQLVIMLPILDHVSFQARKRGLPMEYALIPFVESRFQPKAVAKGGPTGLWQLMPETGRHYGLHIGGKKTDGSRSSNQRMPHCPIFKSCKGCLVIGRPASWPTMPETVVYAEA